MNTSEQNITGTLDRIARTPCQLPRGVEHRSTCPACRARRIIRRRDARAAANSTKRKRGAQ